jgi:anti-sigma regulatory factor (Ser/Thr protein kinase)
VGSEPSSEIVIKAALEDFPLLQQWVGMVAVKFRLPPALAHRFDLCVTELVTNAIDHGYADGRPGTVRVRFWCQSGQITIRIDDDGAPFDPTSHVLPDLPRSLAEATTGGRGIRLVRHHADEIRYQRSAAMNQLALVFRSPTTCQLRSAASDSMAEVPTVPSDSR